MEKLLLIGGGGHAKVVADALRAAGAFELVGWVGPGADEDAALGLPRIGADEDLERLRAEGMTAAAVGVGSIGDASTRHRLFALAAGAGFSLPAVVHPSATVSPAARVSDGVYVGPGAVVCAGAVLGFGCIVNSGAVVDHDCSIGAFAHVAPGAALSGDVTVGDDAHVGTGAAVLQGVRIGARSVIGVGSSVVSDIPDGVVAYGCPCRVVRPVA